MSITTYAKISPLVIMGASLISDFTINSLDPCPFVETKAGKATYSRCFDVIDENYPYSKTVDEKGRLTMATVRQNLINSLCFSEQMQSDELKIAEDLGEALSSIATLSAYKTAYDPKEHQLDVIMFLKEGIRLEVTRFTDENADDNVIFTLRQCGEVLIIDETPVEYLVTTINEILS